MRALLTAPIRAYRWLLGPWLGVHCRFHPTCSAYALEAIERCHPWHPGGLDPVPEERPRRG